MTWRFAWLLLFGGWVAPAWASPPPELLTDLPPEAEESGNVSDPPGRYGVAAGVWDGSDVPFVEMNGTRLRQAYRLPNAPGAMAETLEVLSQSLARSGFEILLSCADQTCGGFDFRHRLAVLPLPAMYVDLGRFRYVSATRGEAGSEDRALVSVLASQSGSIVYLQIDLITPLTAEEATPSTDLPALPPTPSELTGDTGGTGTATASAAEVPPGADDSGAPAVADAFASSGAFVLEGLSFATGAAALTEEDNPSLAALADYLVQNPEARIALVGHTDTTGSLQANITVSRRRAQAVADRLISDYGIARARLMVEGAGYLAPRADNTTEAGRARNRRVTAVLIPPS